MLTITLKEALWAIYDDEATPFSITFVTADEKLKTGGETITIDCATRLPRTTTTAPRREAAEHATTTLPSGKAPRHAENGTINILDQTTQKIVKIHTDLILYFNQKTVIW